MALYVYITKECEEDAQLYNRLAEVNRLKARVETSQHMCHFDNFPPPYLKKRFDRQVRLVADYRTVAIDGEEHTVVTFLRTYKRSSKDYEDFIRDPIGFGNQYLKPLVSDDDIAQYLYKQLQNQPIPAKRPPSELENHYLYRLQGEDLNRGAEEFICESQLWMERLDDKKIKDRLILICKKLAG